MASKVTCGIFIIDPSGKILFCHPTHSAYNYLSIPKGLVELNESYIDAGIREVREETGINLNFLSGDLQNIENLVQYKCGKKALKAFIFKSHEEIATELVCNSFFTLNGVSIPEVDDYFWLTLEDLKNYKLHPTQQQIIDEYIK